MEKTIQQKRKEYIQQWRIDNKEKEKATLSRYKIEHRDEIREIYNRKIADNYLFLITERLKHRLHHALLKYAPDNRLSISEYEIEWIKIAEYLLPIPNKKYHIDHIKPICSFDLSNPVEVRKAFSPENHQWMTPKENIQKRNEDLKLSLYR